MLILLKIEEEVKIVIDQEKRDLTSQEFGPNLVLERMSLVIIVVNRVIENLNVEI